MKYLIKKQQMVNAVKMQKLIYLIIQKDQMDPILKNQNIVALFAMMHFIKWTIYRDMFDVCTWGKANYINISANSATGYLPVSAVLIYAFKSAHRR